jgi:acyl carrier protein
MDRLEKEVIGVVSEYLSIAPSKIERTSRFVQDLGLDSIVAIEIISCLEEKYGIEIPEEKISGLQKVEDLIAFVENAAGGRD